MVEYLGNFASVKPVTLEMACHVGASDAVAKLLERVSIATLESALKIPSSAKVWEQLISHRLCGHVLERAKDALLEHAIKSGNVRLMDFVVSKLVRLPFCSPIFA